jgi:hypothetical protein
MLFWIGLAVGVVIGSVISLAITTLLHMAARGEPNQPDFEPPAAIPVGAGYTWCPSCQALFKGEACPGCAPEPSN